MDRPDLLSYLFKMRMKMKLFHLIQLLLILICANFFVYDLSSISSQQISRFVLIFDQGVVNWDTYFIDDFNISSIPSMLRKQILIIT